MKRPLFKTLISLIPVAVLVTLLALNIRIRKRRHPRREPGVPAVLGGDLHLAVHVALQDPVAKIREAIGATSE